MFKELRRNQNLEGKQWSEWKANGGPLNANFERDMQAQRVKLVCENIIGKKILTLEEAREVILLKRRYVPPCQRYLKRAIK